MSPQEKILIVDDNPDDRALLIRELESEDPSVMITEARNAEELQLRLDSIRYDLVITDYQLNWSTGIDVLKRVKKLNPDCSVIMFTATGGEEVAVEAMKNGLQDYILKSPKHLSQLRTSVRHALEAVKQRRTLQVLETRHRDLFQSIPIGLYQTSTDGRFIEVNRAMVTMLGYPDSQTLMQTDTRDLYVHRDHFDQWKKRTREFGYVRALEVEMWRYDRTVIWVEINGKSVYRNGKLYYNEGSLQDITERVATERRLQETVKREAALAETNAVLYAQVQKYNTQLEKLIADRTKELQVEVDVREKSEAALRETEYKYRIVVEQVREVIYQIDTKGKIVFLNTAWEKITGHTVANSTGKTLASFFHKSDQKLVRNSIRNIKTSGNAHEQVQARIITKSGNERWVELLANVEKFESGKAANVIGMLYDIPERKNAEDEVKWAPHKVKELNELRSKFLSMTSHEFRTPLTSILTSAELIEHYGSRWPVEKNQKHLKRIQQSVQHIIGLMDDFLIIGRADAGKLSCEKARVNVLELMSSAIEEMQPSEKHTHQIVLDTDVPNGDMYIDKKLFRQIVTNIISNAIKYSKSEKIIYIYLFKRRKYLNIVVRDEGIGIPKSDQPQLFESFFRAGNVGDISGTGLGLPIVKRSVVAHGGSIDIQSEVGSGTQVSIKIDVSKSTKEA